MITTPQMGLVLPVPSSTTPDWAGVLNSAFSLIDTHDHTAGHGVPVPSAGIGINADLPFNGFNLTQARTLRLQQQAAAPALAADAGALYATTAGDLWFNNGAGQHIQITSGAALSAASLGGISGLGGTSAGVAFNNGTKTFTFTQAATQAALLDTGPLVIRDTAASAFGITLQSPAGIAGAYSLTLPAALPAANALLSIGTGGALSAFGTVAGTNLTLAGSLTTNNGIQLDTTNTAVKVIIANGFLLLQGNKTATDAGSDVVLASTATRTAGLLAQAQNPLGTGKLDVDYQGLVRLTSQAAPLQPGGYVTAVTPNAGWSINGAAYWKDATGMVHMKGAMSRTTGGIPAFTLPAGFRPGTFRLFVVPPVSGGGAATTASVGTNGDVSLDTTAGTSDRYLDGISFLAEA